MTYPDEEDYYEKFADKLNIRQGFSTRYRSVSEKIREDLLSSSFWEDFESIIETQNDKFLANHGVDLITVRKRPEIYIKPYKSFRSKIYRQNVVQNWRYPGKPKLDWINATNCFERINDIARTTLEVRYIDGVSIVLDAIESLAKAHSITFEQIYEAREDGYYSAHCYLKFPVFVQGVNAGDIDKIEVSFEIQIATQMQQIIKSLTRNLYEEERMKRRDKDVKWQWNYKDEKFSISYLAHMVQYIEGRIAALREDKDV